MNKKKYVPPKVSDLGQQMAAGGSCHGGSGNTGCYNGSGGGSMGSCAPGTGVTNDCSMGGNNL